MKEVVFNENDKFTHISLKGAHEYLRKLLEIPETMYGCFPSDMDEIAVRYNGEGCRKIYITARGKLFELDVENKSYTLAETDLRELKQK